MAPLQAYGYAAGLPIFEPINGVVPLAATHLSTPQTDARGVALGNNAVVCGNAQHPHAPMPASALASHTPTVAPAI